MYRWNGTSEDDDQRQTEDDSHQQDTRGSTSERLMHEPGDLERDSLTNWQPVQLADSDITKCEVFTAPTLLFDFIGLRLNVQRIHLKLW